LEADFHDPSVYPGIFGYSKHIGELYRSWFHLYWSILSSLVVNSSANLNIILSYPNFPSPLTDHRSTLSVPPFFRMASSL